MSGRRRAEERSAGRVAWMSPGPRATLRAGVVVPVTLRIANRGFAGNCKEVRNRREVLWSTPPVARREGERPGQEGLRGAE